MRTDAPNYPYKRNPLRFEDVALGASLHWAVAKESALKYLREKFDDPGDALKHLRENLNMPPDDFWQSL